MVRTSRLPRSALTRLAMRQIVHTLITPLVKRRDDIGTLIGEIIVALTDLRLSGTPQMKVA